MSRQLIPQARWFPALLAGLTFLAAGCGSLKSQTATDQLLISDAIEQSVEAFDFRDLAGTKVYLDTQYMGKAAHGIFNADYIRSALRQRMMASGCELQTSANAADYVVEVRISALGTDGHEVNYGVPASGALNTTASIFTSAPLVPTLPEVSLARKDQRSASVQIHMYAYHRETLVPVWQPDVGRGKSSAKSTWVLGAGPFQRGSIYDKAQFAGNPIDPAAKPIGNSIARWPVLHQLKRYMTLQPLTETITELVSSSQRTSDIATAAAAQQLPPRTLAISTAGRHGVAFGDYLAPEQ